MHHSPLYYQLSLAYMFRPPWGHHQGFTKHQVTKILGLQIPDFYFFPNIAQTVK